jgi:hypothetical protein
LLSSPEFPLYSKQKRALYIIRKYLQPFTSFQLSKINFGDVHFVTDTSFELSVDDILRIRGSWITTGVKLTMYHIIHPEEEEYIEHIKLHLDKNDIIQTSHEKYHKDSGGLFLTRNFEDTNIMFCSVLNHGSFYIINGTRLFNIILYNTDRNFTTESNHERFQLIQPVSEIIIYCEQQLKESVSSHNTHFFPIFMYDEPFKDFILNPDRFIFDISSLTQWDNFSLDPLTGRLVERDD